MSRCKMSEFSNAFISLPMRSRSLLLGGLLLVAAVAARPVEAADLDQRFRCVQWLLDEISLASAVDNRRGACVASLRANDQLLDLLPELQRRRPGINHWALHDRILSAVALCRTDPMG